MKFFCFAIVVLFFGVAGFDFYSDFRLKKEIPEFYQERQAGMAELKSTNYLKALNHFDRAITVAKAYNNGELPFQLKVDLAKVYEKKGQSHYLLWHLDDAVSSLQKAIYYARGTQDQTRMVKILAKLEERIRSSADERNDHDTYRMARGLGPAKWLKGKIVVAYVFLEDRSLSKWSKREINKATLQLDDVLRWYQEKASEYGINKIQFKKRIFIQKKHPLLDSVISGVVAGKDSSLGYRYATLRGTKSSEAFLKKLIRQEKADGAILMIHLNHSARSFVSYNYSRSAQNEFAVIMEKPFKNDWARVEYALAHEGLHLFGAGDLYNVSMAKGYASKDIMHHPSIYLAASTIEELTAYAIGWGKTLPRTPFKVVDLGEKYD